MLPLRTQPIQVSKPWHYSSLPVFHCTTWLNFETRLMSARVKPLTSVQTWGWIWFQTHCRTQGSSRWPWRCGRCLPNSPAGYVSVCCLGTAHETSETNQGNSGNDALTNRCKKQCPVQSKTAGSVFTCSSSHLTQPWQQSTCCIYLP